MFRHTKSDSHGSGQLLPEMRGRRLALYGDSHEDHKHLAAEHSYALPRSYEYGTSKRRLRPYIPPEVLDYEPPRPKPKPRKKQRRFPETQRWVKRSPVVEPVIDAASVRRERYKNSTIYPPYSPPPPKPARRSIYGSGPDPRLTGEDVDQMLADYL